VWYTVKLHDVSLGIVELPSGLLVAGRLEPHAGYSGVKGIVQAATDAFLQLGVFGVAAPLVPPIPAAARARRAAMGRAARLRLTLATDDGTVAPPHFVNLLEAPADGGIVVLAAFVEAPAVVGALLAPVARSGGESGPPAA
jgi:hypothetical protein